jgi:hypothetical protein
MAVKCGRIAQGFEIEKKWADMSRERMNKTQLITGTTEPDKAMPGQQINLF